MCGVIEYFLRVLLANSKKSTAKELGIDLTISIDFCALKSRDLMKEDFRYYSGLEFNFSFVHIDKSTKFANKEVGIALTITKY